MSVLMPLWIRDSLLLAFYSDLGYYMPWETSASDASFSRDYFVTLTFSGPLLNCTVHMRVQSVQLPARASFKGFCVLDLCTFLAYVFGVQAIWILALSLVIATCSSPTHFSSLLKLPRGSMFMGWCPYSNYLLKFQFISLKSGSSSVSHSWLFPTNALICICVVSIERCHDGLITWSITIILIHVGILYALQYMTFNPSPSYEILLPYYPSM